jgi:hypothetical protein
MLSRALWMRALVLTLFGAFLLGGPPRRAFAQEKRTRMVVKYLGHQDDGKHRYQGKPVMLLGVEPLEGGRPIELVVANKDMKGDKYDPVPKVAETVRDLKRGDVIKIELDDTKPKPLVREATRYKLKPGETEPHTYVFENTFRKEEGRSSYTAVVLSRFDEQITVAVQQKRDKDGDMASDLAILELLQKLKTDEVVEAEIKETGRIPVLTSLQRYTPPQEGKFLKLTEQDVEGQKAPAVELERQGKPVTALVQGKMQGKRWVADAKVLGAVKRLKPDSAVVFRARDDGKLWLKEIEPAKDATEASASASKDNTARVGRDDDAKRNRRGGDKDRGDKDRTEKDRGDK